jgi:hypothetical protein
VKSLLVAILAAEQPTYDPKEASIAPEGNNFLSGGFANQECLLRDGFANGSDLKLLAEIDFSYNFRVPFPGLVAQW